MCLPARMIKKPHLVPEFNRDLPVYLGRSVVLTRICAPAIGKSQVALPAKSHSFKYKGWVRLRDASRSTKGRNDMMSGICFTSI